MSDLAKEVGRLRDLEAIRTVLHRYSDIIDSWDVERLRTCFTDDVTAIYNYNDINGIDNLVGYFKDHHFTGPVGVEKLLGRTHFIGNMDIDLQGNEARSKTYLLALNIAQDSSLHSRCNFYTDNWLRIGDHWRIRERHHVTAWMTKSAVILDPDRTRGR